MSKQKNGISLKMKLEAALLASGRPIHIEELSNILKVKPKEIKETLDSLKNIYSKESALELVEFKDSYMLRIRPELAPIAKKFGEKPFLSRSLAKTLSLIAYYGPISVKELKEKRGSIIYSHIKTLEKMRLIKKEETNGQKMYSVTDDFFKLFNVPQNKDELKKTLFNNLQQLEGKQ